MTALRVLGSQPQRPQTQNGRPPRRFAATSGRPFKHYQRISPRWPNESHLLEEVLAMRLPGATGNPTGNPRTILRATGVAR